MPASPGVDSRVTAAEFLVHPAALGASELVRGVIREMTPAGGGHGLVVGRVFAALNAFVEPRRLGQCFADNTGFELTGLRDTVRSPDAAFVSAARLPKEGIGPGWITAAPDLVVEVVSPSEPAADLEAKLDDYRKAGARLAWIIDPQTRTVTVRSAFAADRRLSPGDVLDGGDVLPGFAVDVSRLFVGLAT